MSDHIFIKNVKVGDSFAETYFIEKVYAKTTKTGKAYADYVLRDSSGSMICKHWDAFRGDAVPLEEGIFADFTINVQEYGGKPSCVIEAVCACKEPKDKSAFMKTNKDIADHKDFLNQVISTIEDETCKKIIDKVFLAPFGKILDAPYGTNSAYAYQGGFVKYVYDVTHYISKNSSCFCLSTVERDVLITASLLHKLGVIKGYEINGILPSETKLLKLYGGDLLEIASYVCSR